MAEQNVIDEVLEFIWTQRENGVDSIEKLLGIAEIIEAGAGPVTLKDMEFDGLIIVKGDAVKLTDKGEKAGEEIIRRHRLAERLLHDVLDVSFDSLEINACSFEHSISALVADNICTLLGHPPSCPHGLPIPRGKCCKKGPGALKPVVVPLDEVEAGQYARVVFMVPKTFMRLEKLGSMGLVPGSVLKLTQKKPSFVIEIGATTLALDPDIAKEIFVKKAE
ncbi:MAG: metal-dependent transcriptional regulator [Thermodesulfobacteriota bacterium]